MPLVGVTGAPPLVGVTEPRRVGELSAHCVKAPKQQDDGGDNAAAEGESILQIGGESGCGTVSLRSGFARRAEAGLSAIAVGVSGGA